MSIDKLNEKYKKEFPDAGPFIVACEKGNLKDVQTFINSGKIKDVNKFNNSTTQSEDNDTEDDSSIQSSKTEDNGKTYIGKLLSCMEENSTNNITRSINFKYVVLHNFHYYAILKKFSINCIRNLIISIEGNFCKMTFSP